MNKHYNILLPIWPNIGNHRTLLMGFAMIMVIIYHALCWVYNPIGEFNFGYAGVDIFLFLSGYGLAISFEKNKLSVFYKNRIKRIYPVYVISVIAVFFILNGTWTPKHLFENLLTVGFYVDRGHYRFDWYTEALFSFYLIFPLLYGMRKLKWWGVLFLFCLIAIILYNYEIEWWYECAIARIPIFYFGIIYRDIRRNSSCLWFLIIAAALYFPTFIFISKFLAASFLTIPLIILIIAIESHLSLNQKIIVEFIGTYSLEIYLANLLLMYTIIEFSPSRVWSAILYIPIQTAYSFIIIMLRKTTVKIIGR